MLLLTLMKAYGVLIIERYSGPASDIRDEG